ncbi:DUF7426 family protein [Leifsonia sp. P73]|uniref:DUF7426 family protein n=1 Tax=Leifsonia sp. P73 TaxID=3423959 RepID=UPI003DA43259
MDFPDYNEVVEPLVLPINGKKYTIPPISVDDGVRLTDGLNPESKTVLTDEEFYRLTLGTALDEMRADAVKKDAISRASKVALADHQRSRDTALVLWKTGGDPKALRELVEAALEASTSTTTDEASTTKSPANGSTTTRSRKKPSK